MLIQKFFSFSHNYKNLSFQRIFHKKIEIIETDSKNPDIRNPSNKKAAEILNWRPKITLEEGLKSIFDFI